MRRECLQKVNNVPDIDDIPLYNLLQVRMGMALTLQKLGEVDAARSYYERGLDAYQKNGSRSLTTGPSSRKLAVS